MPPGIPPCIAPASAYSVTSGSPATDVSRDRIPASTAADRQTRQSTSDRIAEVPMVAAAVWATVLSARIAAAFAQAE